MHFWKNPFIPKELQEHIEKTIKKALSSGKQPVSHDLGQIIKDFTEGAEKILSGSQKEELNQKDK